MKLLPQFSIRLMLGATAAVAVLLSVVAMAARGHDWAIGVSLGVAGLAIAFATYAVLFGVLWAFSVVASPMLNRPIRTGQPTLVGTASPFHAPAETGGETPIDAIVVDEAITAIEDAEEGSEKDPSK